MRILTGPNSIGAEGDGPSDSGGKEGGAALEGLGISSDGGGEGNDGALDKGSSVSGTGLEEVNTLYSRKLDEITSNATIAANSGFFTPCLINKLLLKKCACSRNLLFISRRAPGAAVDKYRQIFNYAVIHMVKKAKSCWD